MAFELNVPCKKYDIEPYKYLFNEHIEIYMSMYLPDITPEEKQDLRKRTKYVRFMCFQDEDTSPAYMYAYCRPISQMTPEHLAEATALLEQNLDMALGEINYATRAFFFLIKI